MSARQTIEGTVEFADSRLGSAAFLRRNAKKVFPDHWSFLLGEIALYSFIILILTGIFLSFFFTPSATETVYTGGYEKLQGTMVSKAYASTLHITFDVRGGLLMRQIHHWAALLFVASIMAHMLRIFITGAFRRPREINWIIGITLLILAVAEGFAGYSLPDDLLSGTGVRITQAIILSIPFLGTFASFIVFGGEYPGDFFFERLYIVHVLLIPGILLALITVHLMIVWHQQHTQFPGKGNTERNVRGQPTYPLFMAKTGAFFFFVFGVLALLGAFAQINPVWLYGPYNPAAETAGAQPDWYLGFLEGSMRLMGPLITNVLGHTIVWNIFIPAIVYPTILIIFAMLYPWLERWATGDNQFHHLLDRPRNTPTRTGIIAALGANYGAAWAAGGNDIISFVFDISLQATTWFLRVMFFLGPVIAFFVARRICLGLQRRDHSTLEEGYETGMIFRGPTGVYEEAHEEAPAEERAILASKQSPRRIEASGWAESGVRPPRSVIGRLQARANHFYSNDDVAVVPESEDYQRGRHEIEAREEEEAASSSE